jgi:hypothetical protein
MNYTQLVDSICSTVQNYETDFVANIPLFTKQAEQRIYNTVQVANLRKNVTGSLSSGNKYLSTPGDFLSTYSLAVVDNTGAYHYLLNKDVNFIREAYPTPTSTGLPKYYAIFGPRSDIVTELSFILGPTPDAAYTAELHYFYLPESIVTAGTTWLGDNFDSVLLYGVLVEAYIYLKGEADVLTMYTSKYNEALALLKQLGDGKQRQDAYRSGQARVPVQ